MDNALSPATLARGGVGAEVLQTRQVLKIRSYLSSLLAAQALSWQRKLSPGSPSMLETKLSWTHAVMLHMQRVQLNILVQFPQHVLVLRRGA